MKSKNLLLSFLILFLFASVLKAQNLAIGQWRVHLPLNKARIVADAGNKVYCAAEDGIFSYNKDDNSLETFSKINGLSDIGISAMRYYSNRSFLFIGYENANIDILSEGGILNISDIKRKSVTGSKTINDVSFVNNLAYLACAFGIVVVNLDRMEIKDTYYIGPNGSSINVSGVTTNGNDLFAATDSGVYRVNMNDPNINFFGAWTNILPAVPNIQYNLITLFNNKVYLNNHPSSGADYLTSYDNTSWVISNIALGNTLSLQVANNKIVVTSAYQVVVYNEAEQNIKSVDGNTYPGLMYDALNDNSDVIWIADNNKGLVKVTGSVEIIVPDGPRSKYSAGMQILGNQLWVGHSLTGRKWNNIYSGDGFSTFNFDNNDWTTYDKTNLFSPIVSMDSLYDFMALAIDPRNTNHVFLGSRGAGLLEVENGAIKNYFNESNSTLQGAIGNTGSCQTGGLAFDNNYNLWVSNSTVPAPLSELKTDGTWSANSFPGALSTSPFIGEFMIDSYGQKWMDWNETGVLVYDDSGTLGAVKYKFLNKDSVDIPSNDIRAMAEDRDGQVWIGTASGVAVFYAPASILSYPTPKAQQILLLQDGTYQYLLATEVVTSIAVDGANNKWFGTENSGVFYMSPDGTKQLAHYTAENSPLLSDNITCIAINQKSGEIFFGTDHGIISLRGQATEGADKCADTYVFPNPVYHDYSGIITIQGLIANSDVKITDISGTLVYQTTSLGGQAFWDGKNFKGEKAHTGVYLVFCADQEGKNSCVTKLLFFN